MLFSLHIIYYYLYRLSTICSEIDHRLRKAPKPIPNFEAKPLLARLVLPWGTRWESRVLISFFFLLAPAIFFCKKGVQVQVPCHPGTHRVVQVSMVTDVVLHRVRIRPVCTSVYQCVPVCTSVHKCNKCAQV
jgi:hypothetical protein